MNGLHLHLFAVACVCVFAGNTLGEESRQDRLSHLSSCGILITPDGIGETTARYVVPYDSPCGKHEIDELMQYCMDFTPKSEIVFLGPVVVDEQLRQFRSFLPHSHIRHMAATQLDFIRTCTFDDSYNRTCRIDKLSPAAKKDGLRVGDVIVGIGEYRWPESDSYDSFSHAMRTQLPGEKSTVFVKRNGQVVSLPVTWRESYPSINLTTAADNQAVNRSTHSRGN